MKKFLYACILTIPLSIQGLSYACDANIGGGLLSPLQIENSLKDLTDLNGDNQIVLCLLPGTVVISTIQPNESINVKRPFEHVIIRGLGTEQISFERTIFSLRRTYLTLENVKLDFTPAVPNQGAIYLNHSSQIQLKNSYIRSTGAGIKDAGPYWYSSIILENSEIRSTKASIDLENQARLKIINSKITSKTGPAISTGLLDNDSEISYSTIKTIDSGANASVTLNGFKGSINNSTFIALNRRSTLLEISTYHTNLEMSGVTLILGPYTGSTYSRKALNVKSSAYISSMKDINFIGNGPLDNAIYLNDDSNIGILERFNLQWIGLPATTTGIRLSSPIGSLSPSIQIIKDGQISSTLPSNSAAVNVGTHGGVSEITDLTINNFAYCIVGNTDNTQITNLQCNP